MKKRYDIVTLGQPLVDIMACVDDVFLETAGLEKGARQLHSLDGIASLYKKAPPALEISGGSAANTAAGLASLGLKTAYIGNVNADSVGSIFAHDLEASGVKCFLTKKNNLLKTGRCLIFVTPDMERTMNTYLGASMDITPSDLPMGTLKDTDILFTELYFWELKTLRDTFQHAILAAKKAYGRVAVTLSDVVCAKNHGIDAWPFIRDNADILVGNLKEFEAFFGQRFDQIIPVLQSNFDYCAATKGRDGAVIISPDEVYHQKRFPAERVFDTTGAGDLFATGFLYGIQQEMPISEIGGLASRTAAAILSDLGARSKVPLTILLERQEIQKNAAA